MSEAAAEKEAPVQKGDILAGKYRVERVLGVGGMGVVVAATHLELDQLVALKFLLPAAAERPEVVARFAREAKAAAKIRSEHVARVTDVGALETGAPYLVMEYLEGSDLSELLATKGRLPVATVVDYVLEASEAIAEAHAAGIVHRDLKPSNLFLARRADGSEAIKVLDFGISKAAVTGTGPLSGSEAALTKTTDIFGSPLYMSPEQLKSARNVDARADLWALGVILFELLSDKAPFDRGTVAEIFGAILYEKPPPLEGVPEELERIVIRCLEKDASARYANVAELAQALMPFGSDRSRQSVERTSRVMRRAGVTIASVPPAEGMPEPPPSQPIPLSARSPARAAAATNLAPSPGASTKTSWGAPDAPKPRARGRAALLGMALAFAGAAAVFAVLRRPIPPVVVAADPQPSPQAGTLAPPPLPLPLAPAPSAPVPASASAPLVTPSAAPVAPPPGRLTGKLPAPPPPTATAVAAPPTATAIAKPPSPEDPDGFGDRK